MCTPGVRLFAFCPACPLILSQTKVYPGVPPVADPKAVPSLKPKHWTGWVIIACANNSSGWLILKLKVFLHPSASSTITSWPP